jgi:hypothetical protein
MEKAAGVPIFASSVHRLREAHTSAGVYAQTQWIYLIPMLESKSQAEVDSVVAHEIAYIVLGYHCLPGSTAGVVPPGVTRGDDVPSERNANALISRCGLIPTSQAVPGRKNLTAL